MIQIQPIFVEHFESSGMLNRMINWIVDNLVHNHYLRKEDIDNSDIFVLSLKLEHNIYIYIYIYINDNKEPPKVKT